MRRLTMLVAVAVLLAAGAPAAQGAGGGISITFVDVEGGAATLIVTPAGESVLIDSGFPGDRDHGRLVAAIKAAGLERIDHYVVSHWHLDHVGGTRALRAAVPIGRFYGHRIPDPLPKDIPAELTADWREGAGEPVFLSAGDSIPLRGRRGTPRPRLRVLAADGLVDGEAPGSPQSRSCDDGHEAMPDDPSDNARSLVMHLSYGAFDLFAGGDLTWNVEHKLVCPRPLVRPVDVYISTHHGLDNSNHPALVRALDPRVVIVNNGPRKGGEPRALKLFLDVAGPDAVYQVHRAVRDGAVNTEPGRIANHDEACQGVPLLLRVAADGESYEVEVPSRGTVRRHDAR